ncbi:MAG: ABC transporter substrate-binding protein [Clostridia bacterium]|nr:ABC transporter substrate-binding protein [Clostridia bacterium]
MKRLLAVILALSLLLGGCVGEGLDPESAGHQPGAYGNDAEEHEVLPARNYISMIFYEDMDIHPLTATNRENHELLKLVYSPLIRLNSALKTEYVLAEEVKTEGTTVTLRLKEGLRFSDGSAVTAEDVAAGFKLIKKTPASPYYGRLKNVKRYSVTDGRTVTITLYEADTDFINCLDIPVIQKKGTAGCGPYQFAEQGGERVLVPNPHYFATPAISVIHLKKPADEQERQNMFSLGLLDVYFATAESTLVFSGGKDFQVQTYAGDNLLYLGVNCQSGRLADAKFRGFLSGLIGRQKLTEGVLLGQAEATAYPFQSAWYKAEGLTQDHNWTDPQKKEKAAALKLNLTENMLLDAEGKQLTFTLMALEESGVHKSTAQAVAESLALSGIRLQVETVSREVYNARLAKGEYELYLGEVRTGRTLNTGLYAAGSAINYGFFSADPLEAAAAAYRKGEKSLKEFATVFDQYTPIIPLAYRQGVLFVAADIGEFQSSGTWSLYGDITKLITKETELTT